MRLHDTKYSILAAANKQQIASGDAGILVILVIQSYTELCVYITNAGVPQHGCDHCMPAHADTYYVV
jgi:hypothetical protein